MQKILNRRVFRSLKKHWFRYTALFALIVMIMYIIVSMISSAQSVICSTTDNQEKSILEDGYFQTFLPLEEGTLRDLANQGLTVEKQSYIDFRMSDDSTLRVYKVRKDINILQVSKGMVPNQNGQALIEKLYADNKGMNVKDSIALGSLNFTVSGMGTTAEIESPKKNVAAASADCSTFGLAFVTESDYNKLLAKKEYESSEVYNYAYRLNCKMTNDELEEYLRELNLNTDEVTDPYFKEMIDDVVQTENDITKGVNQLVDGTDQLADGLGKLKNNNDDLVNGAKRIFEETLENTETELKQSGFSIKLTKDNFETELSKLKEDVSEQSSVAALSIGSVKDSLTGLKEFYDAVQKYTDGVSDTSKGSEKLKDGMAELKTNTDDIMDEYFNYDIDNLTLFVIAEDNANIGAAADDVKTTLSIAMLAGVILLVLITYVISIFVIHSIDRETSVIGALYALGVKRKQLTLHYLMLPVFVTFLGGLVGTLIGFSKWAMEQQLATQYAYYSIPQVTYAYPIYLIVYGIIVPPAIAAIVNYIVIRKKLSVSALNMLRNEQKQSKVNSKRIQGNHFIRIFRIRQTLREIRSCAAVVIGLFISLLVFMLGLDCYYGCKNISVQNKRDASYEYMYLYKYTVDEVPKDGEAAYTESLIKQFGEFNYDITICGIDDDNKYFDFDVKKGENQLAVSSSLATKYNLKVGDKLVLTDDVNDRDYAFTVDKIVDYSIGLYAFMDIDSMRDLFEQKDTYFNTVFSDQDLEIENGRLYAVTTKESIEKASDVFVTLMESTFVMLIVMSVIVFVIVMYLMIKVMIDRSAQNIALMKVFGFRKKEVRKLYLDGNFVVVAGSALLCIPLSKIIINSIFPSFVANIPMGMSLSIPTYLYGIIYVVIILCYLLISLVLTKRLNRIIPAEALKNRE